VVSSTLEAFRSVGWTNVHATTGVRKHKARDLEIKIFLLRSRRFQGGIEQ
jgi:hypothetical protein